MAMKHGYEDDIERYKSEVQQRFSLLETGILHRPCTRLLLVNVGGPFNLFSLASSNFPFSIFFQISAPTQLSTS